MTTPAQQTDTWVPTLTFAAKLALVRHQMGWNIKEAALACGLAPQSWRGWELQRRLPHDIRAVARQISERTGVDREWLLDDEPLRHPGQHGGGGSINERLAKRTKRPKTKRSRVAHRPGHHPNDRPTPAAARPQSAIPPTRRRPTFVRPPISRVTA